MPICENCGKKCQTNQALSKHMNSKRCPANKVIYTCEICDAYTTSDNSKYERHVKSCKLRRDKLINKKLDLLIEKQEREKIKTQSQIENLKAKIAKKKRPVINNNYIIANFNNAVNIEDCMAIENITDEILDKCKKLPMHTILMVCKHH